MGLFTDHTFALDFNFTAIAVGDKPVAPEQLHRHPPQIANGYGISKDKTFFIRCGLGLNVDALNLNTDAGRINHGLALLRRRIVADVISQLAVLLYGNIFRTHCRVDAQLS
ncbi:Uncharacterised protein [Enterobacter cloacae]|nr:Uncharacterised protein [Enterobacter cloacae]VAU68989.1 Uncharacterised protein [Klebsiella pneumoniae]